MIPQFQHQVTTSFFLWFDNYLLKRGQAFSNLSSPFYYYDDDRLDNRYKTFGSAYKQWVTDSSISGVNIPTGVSINGSMKGRNDGVIFDFDNGRIISSGISSSDSISGSFSVKDFNIYYTNETEEDLLIDRKYIANPRVYSPASSHITPYDAVVPAIFLSNDSTKNEPFAYGGMDTTTCYLKAIVIAENMYQLDGVLSIFADSRNEVVSTIPFSGQPLTEYGDIKDGSYSYQQYKSAYDPLYPFFFVNSVISSKLPDKAAKTIHNDLYIGFLDFELCQQRYPRA